MAKESFREVQADGLSMKSVLAGAGAVAGEALVAVGVEAVKMASEYQLATTRLVTSAGEQKSNLKMVQDGMLNMAGQVGISANELAKAMYYVEAAGYHGADGLKVLKAAAEGAVAENADVTHVSQALTDVLVDYHLKASAAADITSKMIEAVAHGKTNLEDFSKAFASIVPAASAAGISFNDVGAALANMTNHGFTTQRAAQNLAQALRSLLKPTKPMMDAFQQFGVSADELKAKLHGPNGLTDAMEYLAQAATKAGKEGTPEFAAALRALMGTAPGANAALATVGANFSATTDTINAMAKATADAQGRVQGFALVQHTFGQQIRELDAGFQSLLIRIGLQLLPILSKFISYVMTNGTPIMKQLGDLTKQYIVPVLTQLWQILQNLSPTAQTVFKVFGVAGLAALVAVSAVLHDVLNPALLALSGFLKDNQTIVAGVVAGYIGYRAILLAIATTTALVELATKGATAAQVAWTAATWLFRDSEIAAAAGLEISRIGAIAYAAQALVVEGATKAWTAAQWLLNVALDANPIGLVSLAIVGLAGGFYLLYNRSLLVRQVVNTLFDGWAAAAGMMGRGVIYATRAVVDTVLGALHLLVEGWAKALGWMPGLGGVLKGVQKDFEGFIGSVDSGFQSAQDAADSFQKSAQTATAVKVLQMDIGAWQQNIEKAKSELNSVPASKRAQLLANIADLTAKIDAAQSKIDQLHGKTVTIYYNGVPEGYQGPGGTYTSTTGFSYAAGGVVSAAASGGARNGMVLVGEQGPELVKLPSGSYVTPAGQTRQMLAGAGGGAQRLEIEWVGGNAGDEFLAWLRRNIRIRGGNVQTVLGQGY
jgi:TP901 family phage tail tape measure protein